MSWRSASAGRTFLPGGNEAAHFEKRQHMYRFDDKRRRRFLEDALVADLLDGSSVPAVPRRGEAAGRSASATTAAATSVGTAQARKSRAA
jgi:hypothetical protein